jgi:hypothetical protein
MIKLVVFGYEPGLLVQPLLDRASREHGVLAEVDA